MSDDTGRPSRRPARPRHPTDGGDQAPPDRRPDPLDAYADDFADPAPRRREPARRRESPRGPTTRHAPTRERRPRDGATRQRAVRPEVPDGARRDVPVARLRRPPHVRRRRAVFAATVVLLVFATVTGLLLTGTVYSATDVEVVGVQALSTDEVVATAAVPLGTPLLRLDLDAVSARVAQLPRVDSVRVSRGLTGTVTVEVTERVPVAFWPGEDGAHLVDAGATDFAVVEVPPPGMPELRLRRVDPDDPTAAAAVAVIAGLPVQLRGSVRVVVGESPANVRLTLGDGREVRWGGPEAGERKARVLQALLTQPGRVYDVSSPDLPTVS